MRRTLLATLAAASLVLTGCGGNSSSGGSLGDVTVSKSPTNPKVTVPKGFTAAKTATRILKKGDGVNLAAGQTIKVNYVAVNGRTGKQFDSSFTSHKPLPITLLAKAILPGFIKGLTGQSVGSRVLVAIAPKDGFGKAQPDLGMKKNDTMVFLFDVVGKIAPTAAGPAENAPKDTPTLVLDSEKQPSKFAKSKSTAKKPKESAHVLIKGTGATIESGQTVVSNYLGQIYPSGKVFDTSWATGIPQPFQMVKGAVVKCFTDKIPGLKVGSRVVIVCPPKVGYGSKGNPAAGIKGTDTLIFSVDLLDAF